MLTLSAAARLSNTRLSPAQTVVMAMPPVILISALLAAAAIDDGRSRNDEAAIAARATTECLDDEGDAAGFAEARALPTFRQYHYRMPRHRDSLPCSCRRFIRRRRYIVIDDYAQPGDDGAQARRHAAQQRSREVVNSPSRRIRRRRVRRG